MRKFWICTLIAIAMIVLVFGYAASEPRAVMATPRDYVLTLFYGPGAEAMRRHGYVYFYRRSGPTRAWYWYRVQEAALDEALSRELRVLIDQWLRDKGRDGNPRHLNPWELERFSALTGYDPRATELSPLQWWDSRDWRGGQAELDAYVASARRHAHLRHSLPWNHDAQQSALRLLVSEDYATSSFESSMPPQVQARIEAFRSGTVRRLNAAFEALYFTGLVYFFGYGYPAIRRCLRRWVSWSWLRGAVLAAVIYVAFVFPFELGYAAPSFTGENKGGLVYGELLNIYMFPVFIGMQVLVPAGVFKFARELDKAVYPVLAWFDSVYPWIVPGQLRSTLTLIGLIPFVIGGAISSAIYGAMQIRRCVNICWECQYDLHGLRDSTRCPECGHPFHRNASGDAVSSRPENMFP